VNGPSAAVEALEAADVEKYRDLSKDSLLCFAVAELREKSVPLTFENVAVAAFKLFPEHFSLIGYLNYPDASRVNRTLLHARPKYRDLIIGNAKSGYALTSKGESVARQVALDLQSTSRTTKARVIAPGKRTYTGHAVVEQIEQSSLYNHWHDDQAESIGDYEVWDFLEAMPYTDKTMLRSILKNYKEAAELSGRQDVIEFLAWVSKQYRYVFQEGEARG
jgi:hypothetical protein